MFNSIDTPQKIASSLLPNILEEIIRQGKIWREEAARSILIMCELVYYPTHVSKKLTLPADGAVFAFFRADSPFSIRYFDCCGNRSPNTQLKHPHDDIFVP